LSALIALFIVLFLKLNVLKNVLFLFIFMYLVNKESGLVFVLCGTDIS